MMDVSSPATAMPAARLRRPPPRFGLAAKILALLLPLVLGSTMALSWFFAEREDQMQRRELRLSLENFAELQTTAMAPMLWNLNMASLRTLFRAYSLELDVASVKLYDPNGQLILTSDRPDAIASAPDLQVWKSVAIEHNGSMQHLGDLDIRFHDTRLRLESQRRLHAAIAVTLLLTVVNALAIVLVLRGRVSRPLRRLLRSLECAAFGQGREPVSWTSTDELGQVVDAYNDLMRRESAAEQALHDYRDHLEEIVGQRTRELAEREAFLQAIVDNAGVGIASAGPDGNLRQVNGHLRGFVNQAESELIGNSLTAFMHPEDGGVAEDQYRLVASGQLPHFHMEGRFPQMLGEPRWGALTVAAIRGDDGRVAHVITVVADITETRMAGERFRALLESAPDVMVIVRADGSIAMANRRAEEFFGYSRREMVDAPVEMLVPERHREQHARQRTAFTEAATHRPMHQQGELLALTRDGREVPVEVSLSPIATDQGILVASALRDVTQRRQAEIQTAQAHRLAEQASRAKSEFLTNMSHEIRTPMNAIVGFSHLALTADTPSSQRGYLEKLNGAARSLVAIINDILDFSKLDSGNLTVQAAPFRLDILFGGLTAQFAPRAAEAGLSLSIQAAPNLPKVLLGDAARLEQVLHNLIDNAFKFTEAGGVTVRCENAGETGGRTRLHFSVVDTGIGMSDGQVDDLFQPFHQGDGSTTRRRGGTGLGLAICRRLVGMMGAELTVASAPAAGTTLSFTLELSSTAEPVKATDACCSPAPSPPPPAPDQADAAPPPALLLATLTDLRRQVAEDDTGAQPVALALAERLTRTPLGRLAAELASLLAVYDFPAALAALDRLAASAAIPPVCEKTEELPS